MRKKLLSLFLAMVLALSLAAPAFAAAKVDVSDMPGHEILAKLPETLQRPARPTTLEQAYVHIDNVKLGTKWSDESTLREITELTDSLTAGKSTDTQKMKAIFDWVSQNIEYDYVALGYYGIAPWEMTEEEAERAGEAYNVFHAYTNRKAVCDGYADLCWLMGTIAGIPVAWIEGGPKGGGVPHAWNAALVDGKWVFFDATWHEWDMGPDYHKNTHFFVYYDGLYQLTVGNDNIYLRLRQGFQDQCPASVTIPSFVTVVDGNAFEGCTGLERVTIPDSVNTIWPSAFAGCTNLKSITIPDSVTEIEGNLFTGCTSLESVTISNGVTRIWREAFDGCTSLKSITIPGSVTRMDEAFYGCTALESVTIERGVTSIGFSAFTDCTSLKNVTIPDTVKTIEDQAFWNCTSLESITIPEGVTSIGKLAFADCTNLKQADLPDSVTSVDGSAFSGCTSLKQSATIPAGMTTIPAYMFRDRTDLTSFAISAGVTSIGSQAFQGCTGLTSITIPASVTSIGYSAFNKCSGLTNVTISDGVTEIGDYAFAFCTNLTSVTIPNSVTKIGKAAFSGCTSLTSVTLPSGAIEINDAFGGTPWWNNWLKTQGQFAVMNKMLLKYQGAGGAVTIPSGITAIGGGAFSYSDVTSVTIPSGVTSIGNDAFSGCFGLKSVTIPSSVRSIGDSAFSHCTGLESITIPEGVTSIGYYAFNDCTGLKTAAIPNSVTELGYRAFMGCTGLTSVTIGSGVTGIETAMFEYCKQLASVAIPASVAGIDDGAFKYCTSLTDVYYGGTKEQWGAIQIKKRDNEALTSVAVHFNSPMPKPTEPEQPVAHPDTQTVTIDGKKVEFQTYSLKDEKGNDTRYIKIRDLALALKGTAAQFDVDRVNGVITFTSGGDYKPIGSENSTPYSGKQTYTKNSGEVSVNGTKYPIDAFQITHNGAGYTYFQMKDIAQKLNFNMAWRGSIVIETDKPYTGK